MAKGSGIVKDLPSVPIMSLIVIAGSAGTEAVKLYNDEDCFVKLLAMTS
jgi:hypothetical protein